MKGIFMRKKAKEAKEVKYDGDYCSQLCPYMGLSYCKNYHLDLRLDKETTRNITCPRCRDFEEHRRKVELAKKEKNMQTITIDKETFEIPEAVALYILSIESNRKVAIDRRDELLKENEILHEEIKKIREKDRDKLRPNTDSPLYKDGSNSDYMGKQYYEELNKTPSIITIDGVDHQIDPTVKLYIDSVEANRKIAIDNLDWYKKEIERLNKELNDKIDGQLFGLVTIDGSQYVAPIKVSDEIKRLNESIEKGHKDIRKFYFENQILREEVEKLKASLETIPKEELYPGFDFQELEKEKRRLSSNNETENDPDYQKYVDVNYQNWIN
jgi:hypothetical protein